MNEVDLQREIDRAAELIVGCEYATALGRGGDVGGERNPAVQGPGGHLDEVRRARNGRLPQDAAGPRGILAGAEQR